MMVLLSPVVSGQLWNCLAEGASQTQLNANIRYETATADAAIFSLPSRLSSFLSLFLWGIADPAVVARLISPEMVQSY